MSASQTMLLFSLCLFARFLIPSKSDCHHVGLLIWENEVRTVVTLFVRRHDSCWLERISRLTSHRAKPPSALRNNQWRRLFTEKGQMGIYANWLT